MQAQFPAGVQLSLAICSLVALCIACSEATPPDPETAGGASPGGAGGSTAGTGGGAGGAANNSGGASSGGTNSSAGTGSGGTNAAGTGSGGTNAAGAGSGGTNAAGAGSGGTSAAGTGSGGINSSGGTDNSGGASAGGMPGGAGGAGGSMAGSGAGAGIGGSAGGASGGSSGGGGAAGSSAMDPRSPGCGTALNRPNPRTQQTMEVDGATRYYLLDVPANTDNDTPLALVFGLHGYDMNNVAVIDLYNFTSRSNGGAITVLPQGEGPPPGDVSHWGDHVLESTWTPNETNYNFIRSLMLDLEDRYCIDTNRVFIAGFSMGGFFTNSLACAHHDWFRAFAPVAGGGPGSCANAAAKPPIMIHHGTADDIVEISSGEGSRDFWVEQNGCSQTTSASFSGCQSYGGCPDTSPVHWCVGNWNHTVSSTASANIWSFFDGFE